LRGAKPFLVPYDREARLLLVPACKGRGFCDCWQMGVTARAVPALQLQKRLHIVRKA
jgi:hypothetical protein